MFINEKLLGWCMEAIHRLYTTVFRCKVRVEILWWQSHIYVKNISQGFFNVQE
ncbi:hypothetical protein C7972_103374 [Arenibacter sp. ARW7G5Y1]|nr:hypothetical protein C7972_103374 [Arenibacter sp. ARW7G5Y1]